LNAAKGKYVWFAESDNYTDIYFLEKMVPLLASIRPVNYMFDLSLNSGVKVPEIFVFYGYDVLQGVFEPEVRVELMLFAAGN
jgi:hypothetical protein